MSYFNRVGISGVGVGQYFTHTGGAPNSQDDFNAQQKLISTLASCSQKCQYPDFDCLVNCAMSAPDWKWRCGYEYSVNDACLRLWDRLNAKLGFTDCTTQGDFSCLQSKRQGVSVQQQTGGINYSNIEPINIQQEQQQTTGGNTIPGKIKPINQSSNEQVSNERGKTNQSSNQLSQSALQNLANQQQQQSQNKRSITGIVVGVLVVAGLVGGVYYAAK